jgi:hypothetical protein
MKYYYILRIKMITIKDIMNPANDNVKHITADMFESKMPFTYGSKVRTTKKYSDKFKKPGFSGTVESIDRSRKYNFVHIVETDTGFRRVLCEDWIEYAE